MSAKKSSLHGLNEYFEPAFNAVMCHIWFFKSRPEAHIAQMVEHSLGKGEVTGSIPVVGTSIDNRRGIAGATLKIHRCN